MPTLPGAIIGPRRAYAELGEFNHMSPTSPIVRLEDVDVDIDGKPVLREISLAIAAGQHWGIVGGNGSGKSTLLALLAGKRWPAPGRGSRRYDFGDGPEHDAVTARERIALFGHELQDLYFARGWNFFVRDIVLSGLTRSDIPKRSPSAALVREAQTLLELMRLEHLAGRRLLELSRGEQRRVLIARAVAFNPALLLLDEPASGLDGGARAELDAMLRQAAGRTQLVIATHRQDELPAFVTHMAGMAEGRLKRAAILRDQSPDPASLTVNERHKIGDDDANKVIIELERASVWLKGRQILNDLDWQLLQGDHWLITGANGSGKSTLLRMLHGELRPARGGEIRWPGLGDPPDVWTLRRRIALVSPEYQAKYLYPTRTFDAIASGLHASIGLVRPLTADQRLRVQALLAAFELEDLRDRALTSLSYGQRHRALIARTLVTNPRVLLLDEPWEGLDRKNIDIVRRELSRRMESGTQIVLVSHVGAHGLPLNRSLTIAGGRLINGDDSDGLRESSASVRFREQDSRPH
jgi:molybdate transport system ATP-binding protein